VEILRQGSEGAGVERWQQFLLGLDLLECGADGIFGPFTDKATRAYQRRKRIAVDGMVGPQTYAAALNDGFDPGFSDPRGGTAGVDWPPKPLFAPLISNAEREAVYGRFRYERIARGKDDVRVVGDWAERNLVTVTLPQLRGIRGAPASGRVRLHKKWPSKRAHCSPAGRARAHSPRPFVGRHVRATLRARQLHAALEPRVGAGFDINAEWNALGHVPALRPERGSVRELVPDANELGFYWGGHFLRRSDGMHFEVARPLG
jgi:hypothetical protein